MPDADSTVDVLIRVNSDTAGAKPATDAYHGPINPPVFFRIIPE